MGLKGDADASYLAVYAVIKGLNGPDLKKGFLSAFLQQMRVVKAKMSEPALRNVSLPDGGPFAAQVHAFLVDASVLLKESTQYSDVHPQYPSSADKKIKCLGQSFGSLFGAIEYGILDNLFPKQNHDSIIRACTEIVRQCKSTKFDGRMNLTVLRTQIAAISAREDSQRKFLTEISALFA